MFYSYNNLTGRLVGTSQFQAYNPQGFRPSVATEPVQIVLRSHDMKPARETPSAASSTRSVASSSGQLNVGTASPRIKRLQEHFGKNDGVPVYLKGGPRDRVLFLITVGLCVVGLAESLRTIITYSMPKKN